MRRQAIHIKRQLLFFTIIATMFTVQPILAQDDFEDDVDDEPAVPIDNYVYVGMILGVGLGIRYLKSKQEFKKA